MDNKECMVKNLKMPSQLTFNFPSSPDPYFYLTETWSENSH